MTAALGGAAASLADFAATLLDPQRPAPSGLRTWNGSDPATRLAVHRNNVVASLTAALADTFPVVRQLVGDDSFGAMAGVFVRRSPPRSCILAFYGQDFPDFVERYEPARALVCLADVARLEAARVRAFHAADAEPVVAEAVARALASGERIGELCLACHPSLQTLASRYAVVSLWAAHRFVGDGDGDGDGDVAVDPAPVDVDRAECAVVVRPGFDVEVHRAPAGTVDFVAAVQRGLRLGDAAAAATAAVANFDLAATLTLLLAHGALTAIELPDVPRA